MQILQLQHQLPYSNHLALVVVYSPLLSQNHFLVAQLLYQLALHRHHKQQIITTKKMKTGEMKTKIQKIMSHKLTLNLW
jgi:hypothetical protein